MAGRKKKAGRVPRLKLQAAMRLVARLAGWRGAPSDGEPGAESVEAGLRRLMDLVAGWRLRVAGERARAARRRAPNRKRRCGG